MHKRHYEKAAAIVRNIRASETTRSAQNLRAIVRESFVELFTGDNPRFDAERFRAACEPRQ